jgi:voltage-gated potassium channel
VASDIRDLFVERPVLRRALVPVLSLGVVAALTSSAFVLLTGIHPVDSVFWLMSPDSISLYFRETSGPERTVKAVAIIGRLGIVVAGLWIGQTVVSVLFGGQITEELKQMQQERTIEGLEDHTVVCGYGMFGQTVVNQVKSNNHDVVVIERSQDVIDEADEDVLVVNGDARQASVLRDAGVDRAETVVAAVDDSHINIEVSIAARALAPDAELVARIGEQEYAQLARRAGADSVVIPEVMSGQDIASEISRRTQA